MREINIHNLGIKNNQLVSYERKSENPYEIGYCFTSPKKMNHWWGKTFFQYDTKQNKLSAVTLNWFGVALHVLFGYRKDLNRQNFWEFFKDQHLVDVDASCPSKEKCSKIFKERLFDLAKREDLRREYLKLDYTAPEQEKIAYFATTHLDINTKDENEISVLYRAAERREVNLIRYLIQNGADINFIKETDAGQVFIRPFDFAVYHGNAEMFDLFIKAGVDVNGKSYKGRTPIFYALGAEAQSARLEDRFKIDEKVRRKMINELLDKNCELNIADDYGLTPLDYAIMAEDLESVNSMLEKGVDANFKTSLPFAIKTNNTDLINLLFEKGAIIDPESYSSIAFNLSQNFSIPILEKLLEHGFPIDTLNKESQTLLHLSVMKNEYDFAKILLERGAAVHQQDANGKKAIDFAKIQPIKDLLNQYMNSQS